MGQKQSKHMGWWLFAGAVAGYVGSLFISSSTRNKHKKYVVMLAKAVGDEKERDRVKKVFGAYTKDSVKKYRKTREILGEKLGVFGEEIKNLDKKSYLKAVRKAVDESVKQQMLAGDEIEKLRKMLVRDFDRIKKAIMSSDES